MFAEYMPGSRTVEHQTAIAQWLGLVALSLPMALFWAQPEPPGPGLYSATGIAIGLHLVLWGAFHLFDAEPKSTPVARYLIRMGERWFPFLLFGVKYSFLLIVLTLLWQTLDDVGLRVGLWLQILFGLLLVSIPLRRLTSEWAYADDSSLADLCSSFVKYLMRILITILVAVFIEIVIIQQSSPYHTDTDMFSIFIWIVALLNIFSSVVLFLGRFARFRNERAVARRTPPSS